MQARRDMARLLIVAKRPANNPVDGWQRGDIIQIFDDGQTVGSRCNKAEWIAAGRDSADWPGTFVTVNITGVDAAKLKTIKTLLEEDTGEFDELGGKIPINKQRIRLRHLDMDDVWAALPQAKKTKLLADGEITVAWDSVKNFVRNKVI